MKEIDAPSHAAETAAAAGPLNERLVVLVIAGLEVIWLAGLCFGLSLLL
jgi:hypothetical protein